MARICTVDDQASVRAVIRHLLEAEGHVVLEAENGRALMDGMIEDIDLVITDMLMPDVDGLEVIRFVKCNRKSLPVLVVTGGWPGQALDLVLMAQHLGADRAISKAQIAQDLVPLVTDLLKGRSRSAPPED